MFFYCVSTRDDAELERWRSFLRCRQCKWNNTLAEVENNGYEQISNTSPFFMRIEKGERAVRLQDVSWFMLF